MKHEETITNISTQACQEQLLYDEMWEIQEFWKVQQLESKPYKQDEGQYTGMYILSGTQDTLEDLDESLAKLN